METEQQASGDPTQVSDQTGEDQKQIDTVAHSTYMKVLGEKKRRDQEVNEMREKLKSYEHKELESKGQQDTLIKSLREELGDTKAKLADKDKRYAYNVVSDQIKSRASKEGCLNSAKLMKLMSKDDFAALQVDDNYQVNNDDLERLISKVKGENDFLFNKPVASVKDMTPNVDTGKKTLSELSLEEKLKLL